MKKNILIGGLIVVAGIAAWFLAPQQEQAVTDMQSAPALEEVEAVEALSWRFEDAGMDEEISAPRTRVILETSVDSREIGVFTGSCSNIADSSWELLEGEQTGVICWWAGGGSEIGVFDEGGQLVVKQGFLEEGTAETAGFRGDFSTLFVL